MMISLRTVLLLLIGLFTAACAKENPYPQPFVAAQWRGPAYGGHPDLWERRYCMHESLIEKYLKPGMPRQRVLELLGAPYHDSPTLVTYTMSPGGTGADHIELRIEFDDAGRLTKVSVLQT